jgi:hypothetical protein
MILTGNTLDINIRMTQPEFSSDFKHAIDRSTER